MNLAIRRYLWWLLMAALLLALLLLVARPVHAADVRAGETIVVAAGETVDDDLVITGDSITIDGVVRGDLVAAGSYVVVNGTVEGSSLIAAQSIVVNGTIDGSLYSAGYAIELGKSAAVGRNLYAGGFGITTVAGSFVERSAYIAGYQALLHGSIGRDVVVGVSALELDGAVGGNVSGEISVGDDAPPLPFFGLNPVASGVRIDDDAVIGGAVDLQEVTATAEPQPDRTLQTRAGELITLLLLGAVLLWLREPLAGRIETELTIQPAISMVWGAVVLIVTPVVLIVGFGLVIALSIIGGFLSFGQLVPVILGTGSAVLAMATALFLLVALLGSKLLVALCVGDWLFARAGRKPQRTFWPLMGALLLGVVLFELVRLIPVVGAVVALATIVIGVGAIVRTFGGRRFARPLAVKPVEKLQPA